MTYTSHGYHIPGSPAEEGEAPSKARCGGPGLCAVCMRERNQFAESLKSNEPFPSHQNVDGSSSIGDDIKVRTGYDGRHSDRAIEAVCKYRQLLERRDDAPKTLFSDVYVVSFTYTLGNWKAMVSTRFPDNKYYEVTYNKDKGEIYLDEYVKTVNVVIPDDLRRTTDITLVSRVHSIL